MFVIAAIVPTANGNRQLAAKKVDQQWRVFAQITDESPGLTEFAAWLDPEDTVCVWDVAQRNELLSAWGVEYLGDLPCLVLFANEKVCLCLRGRVQKTDTLYQVAKEEALIRECLPEDAQGRVRILRRLFAKAGFSQAKLCRRVDRAKLPQQKSAARIKRNRTFLSTCDYSYVYTPDSTVFHRKSCPCILNARKIQGNFFYDTAAHERTPCKLCKPVPLISPEEEYKSGRYFSRTISVEDSTAFVRLIDGSKEDAARGTVIGYCHCALHRGALNKKLLDAHDCLGKNCTYLQKYADRPFWTEREERRAAKAASKDLRRSEREHLAEVKQVLDHFASREHLSIISVEAPNPRSYTVFYVSDNPFADGNRFPEFLQSARDYYSDKRIVLRHIKGPDGRFVTREQFRARRR